ncbi:MAG: N-methyl-L-tryptophan oxidase [Planctomycetota bacterium]|nr:N-methyl-L-tryptophan oxidase [Planctomycetota bacterium]MDA1263116.1 N-methyl-L-tryptophan oxidase [Planctomycetota bacterium]
MSQQWDVIVVGMGAMGSAAVWHLARRGKRVLGIEQFSRGHDRGSSHGGSRIIRFAYFEHSDYVPLLQRSDMLWKEIEKRSGEKLVHRCGVLYGGVHSSEVIAGVKHSSQLHGIPIESINPAQIGSRFPAFAKCSEPIEEFLFEPNAGFVRPERAICAMLDDAQRNGAVLREGQAVQEWRERGEGVEVTAGGVTHLARELVLCPGAWTHELAQAINVPLVNTRQVIGWITPREPTRGDSQVMPAFFIERENGVPMFGVPMASDQGSPSGIKVGFHGDGQECFADSIDRVVRRDEMTAIEAAFARAAPGVAGAVTASSVCMYTNTPDGHFIIDRIPGCQRTTIACGFCGHGFKFAPVVGEILADLAQMGETKLPADFLRRKRLMRD